MTTIVIAVIIILVITVPAFITIIIINITIIKTIIFIIVIIVIIIISSYYYYRFHVNTLPLKPILQGYSVLPPPYLPVEVIKDTKVNSFSLLSLTSQPNSLTLLWSDQMMGISLQPVFLLQSHVFRQFIN